MPQPSSEPQLSPTSPPRDPDVRDRHFRQSPEPRYYEARSTRRGFLLGGLVLAVGGGAVAYRTGAIEGLLDRVLGEGEVVRGSTVGLADIEPPPPSVEAGVEPAAGGVRDWGFRSIGMVGDSITAGSLTEIEYVLAAHGVTETTIDGVPSRRIDIGSGNGTPLSGIRTLFGLLADGVQPDAWVIALGTNDVGQYAEASQYATLIETMVDMLPDDVPLVWVDVYRPEYPEATDTFNRLVRERLQRRDRSAVASWFDVASRPDQAVLQRDLIHPNPDGCAAFAGLVAAALSTLS